MFNRFIFIGVLVAATGHAQIVLPEGKGKEIVDNDCQECHGLEEILSQSQPAARWRKTIGRMIDNGASLTSEDIETVVDYLTTYFGPETVAPKININKADADELRKALGISAAEAGSIIRLRGSGRLKSWEDLVRMNAALGKKLAAKRDVIAFQ